MLGDSHASSVTLLNRFQSRAIERAATPSANLEKTKMKFSFFFIPARSCLNRIIFESFHPTLLNSREVGTQVSTWFAKKLRSAIERFHRFPASPLITFFLLPSLYIHFSFSRYPQDTKKLAHQAADRLMVAAAPKPESPSLSDLSISDLTQRLSPITHYPGTPPSVFTNWATTFRSQTQATFKPRSVDQVRWIVELARREGKELRAAGAGHSPSDIVCTGGFVMDLRGLDQLLEVSCFSRTSSTFSQSARSRRLLEIAFIYRVLTPPTSRLIRKR